MTKYTWRKYSALVRYANIDGRRWYVKKIGPGKAYNISKANDGWQTGTTSVAVAIGQNNAISIAEKYAALASK